MEAIANGPLSQLLVLMMIPVAAVVLLVGLLIYFGLRRRKKSEMKHGLTVGSAGSKDPTAAIEAEVNPDELANSSPRPADPMVSTDNRNDLDLGILLTKDSEMEPTMDEPLESANDKSVDLAARLNYALPNSPQPGQASEPVELLRLLRDPASGQLLVEIGGKRYSKLGDVTDKGIGQYILQITAHLLAFTNGRIVTNAGMKSVYKPRVQEAPLPIENSTSSPSDLPAERATDTRQESEPNSTGQPLVPEPPPEAQAAFLSSLDLVSKEPEPTSGKGGLFRRAPKPPPSETTIPALNLAEEINNIVQARLRYSPLAEGNRIEVMEDHIGGIRIRVNDAYFKTPEEIPDPEVKELIQASIKEWERI